MSRRASFTHTNQSSAGNGSLPGRRVQWLPRAAWWLAGLYLADRLLRLAAASHFLQRAEPEDLPVWPRVTILQPITRGASDLPGVLAARAALNYPGQTSHVLICDRTDHASQALCSEWLAAQPELDVELVLAEGAHGPVASKLEKLHAGLPHATGDVLCFVDDDVILRPAALTTLVRYLETPRAGATFGLACYTNWDTAAASLMSAFVNSNALLTYLPLTYLAPPFTITGHFFCIRREVFATAGGLGHMEGRIDDDHELARRVRSFELRCVQTPALYDVNNSLADLAAYANQIRRWFIIPRQAMLPGMSFREQLVTMLGSAGNLIPPLLAILAVTGRARGVWQALCFCLACFAAAQGYCERRYLGRQTPPLRWPYLIAAALITPLQALAALLGKPEFTWRGQRLYLHRGGAVDLLEE